MIFTSRIESSSFIHTWHEIHIPHTVTVFFPHRKTQKNLNMGRKKTKSDFKAARKVNLKISAIASHMAHWYDYQDECGLTFTLITHLHLYQFAVVLLSGERPMASANNVLSTVVCALAHDGRLCGSIHFERNYTGLRRNVKRTISELNLDPKKAPPG